MRIHPIKQHIAATLIDLHKLEADGHLEHAPRYIISVLEDLHDLQEASEAFYQVIDNSIGNSVVVEKLESLITENLKPIERHSLMLSIECHAVMRRISADAVNKTMNLEEIATVIREIRDLRLTLLGSDGLHTEADEARWACVVAEAKGLMLHSIH
jgi:hypothetical protein